MNTALIDMQTRTCAPHIKWDECYSVCVNEFDRQHRLMMLIVNQIHEYVDQGGNPADISQELETLGKCTREHFAAEEEIFDLYAYPWTKTHKDEHQAFLDNITVYTQDYREGKSAPVKAFLQYFCEWLKNHIVSRDKTYTYFLATRGID